MKGPRSLSALALLSPVFEEVPARPSTHKAPPTAGQPKPSPTAKQPTPIPGEPGPPAAASGSAPPTAPPAAAAAAAAAEVQPPSGGPPPSTETTDTGPRSADLDAPLRTSLLVAGEICHKAEPSLVAPVIGPAMPAGLPGEATWRLLFCSCGQEGQPPSNPVCSQPGYRPQLQLASPG